MNRIYKTVWNEALAAWVAVQETAKSHGKSASSGVGGVGTVVLDRSGIKKAQRFAPAVIVSALALAAGQANAAPGIYIMTVRILTVTLFLIVQTRLHTPYSRALLHLFRRLCRE